MPIPYVVTRDDLRGALAPLCELLGTSIDRIYARPPIVIAEDWISFAVPVTHELTSDDRPPGLTVGEHAQGLHPEAAHIVTVRIDAGDTDDAVVDEAVEA